MVNKEFIKTTFLKEFDYYLNNRKEIGPHTTPLLHKISMGLNEDDVKNYIKNFHKWVLDENDFGYNMLDKMFDIKEIPLFKIKYNGKEYTHDVGDSPQKWFKHFIQDNNFTIDELINFSIKFNTKKSQNTFSKSDGNNYTPLTIENQILYFQNRHFGLDKMNKDRLNPNGKQEGWGLLQKTLKELNPKIEFIKDGYKIIKKLGNNCKQPTQRYENNNSNL
jgi:hypothetical protein